MNEIEERERRIKHKLKDYESSFSINGKKVDLSKIEDHSLHIEDFEECRGNTRGHIELFKKLDIDTLKRFTNDMLKNSSMKIDCVTYDEMLINVIIPELINRLDKNDK